MEGRLVQTLFPPELKEKLGHIYIRTGSSAGSKTIFKSLNIGYGKDPGSRPLPSMPKQLYKLKRHDIRVITAIICSIVY